MKRKIHLRKSVSVEENDGTRRGTVATQERHVVRTLGHTASVDVPRCVVTAEFQFQQGAKVAAVLRLDHRRRRFQLHSNLTQVNSPNAADDISW